MARPETFDGYIRNKRKWLKSEIRRMKRELAEKRRVAALCRKASPDPASPENCKKIGVSSLS